MMELKVKQKIKELEIVIFDFDGVFTDNHVYVDEFGNESVKCFRSDGIGISKLQKLGLKVFIVSTETNDVVKKRAKKLNISCYNGIENKEITVTEIAKNNKVNLSKVCFVGNDVNDIPALKIVGFPVGVKDSFNEIEEYLIIKTKKKGGYGAVRELCDMIVNEKISN